MSGTATVIRCPACGKANRVRPAAEGTPRCAACHTQLPWLVEAREDTFDAEITASVPVLVDFWAAWCPPCRMVAPVLERLARARAGSLKVVKVDTEATPRIAERYAVRGLPSLVLLRDGAEVDRLAGAVPEPRLTAWLDGHLATADVRK